MRLAILDLTSHPEPLLTGSSRASTAIRDWLAPALPDAEMTVFDIAEGGEALPQSDEFSGFIISGSECGVYDDTAWMQPLRHLLLAARQNAKPIYGICFGHQIMADTFGGKAQKAACGRVVGARHFTSADGDFNAHVWHQDQVTRIPPQARVTATADYCLVAALDYSFPARSVQYHPEFDAAHLIDLFEKGRNVLIDEASATEAMNSMKNANVRCDLGAASAAEFFRANPR